MAVEVAVVALAAAAAVVVTPAAAAAEAWEVLRNAQFCHLPASATRRHRQAAFPISMRVDALAAAPGVSEHVLLLHRATSRTGSG